MKSRFDFESTAPACIGTGLMALDVVVNGDPKMPPRLWAGGSFGNVMIILSSFGWKSFPVARLGSDAAAEIIVAELAKFNVMLDFVQRDAKASTPIIIEQIKRGADGGASHRFLRTCPCCGKWLPGYRAILLKVAQTLKHEIPKAETFYFDRATPGTLELARTARANGALVFFEPPGIRDDRLFHQAIRLSNIVKYSKENIEQFDVSGNKEGPLIIAQTLGARGIRYKLRRTNTSSSPWKEIEAFGVRHLRDAAGSGDWCTAGLIHLLGQGGAIQLENMTEDELVNALKFGQALAALNCCFEGARGGMYILSKAEIEHEIEKIMNHEWVECSIGSEGLARHFYEQEKQLSRFVCGSCEGRPL